MFPLEPGERILAGWTGSYGIGSLGKVVVTTHRFLYFQTKGLLHPTLQAIVPEGSFRLEAIAPPSFHNAAKSRWIEVGGQKFTVDHHPQQAADLISNARERRLAELGLPAR